MHKNFSARLLIIASDDHTVDIQLPFAQIVNQAHHVHIVSNAEIAANFVALDISRIHANDNLRRVPERMQQLNFRVLIKSRQHSFSVLIAYQFTAKLQIKLVIVFYSFANIFRLLL